MLTGVPVFFVFCTHLPGGRFALEIEAIGHLRPGEEHTAVADYLKQLEARIATSRPTPSPTSCGPVTNRRRCRISRLGPGRKLAVGNGQRSTRLNKPVLIDQ